MQRRNRAVSRGLAGVCWGALLVAGCAADSPADLPPDLGSPVVASDDLAGPWPPPERDAGPPVSCPSVGPAVCTPDRVCWENPLPQGNYLHYVDGRVGDGAWFGGESGTALHFDGDQWRGYAGLSSGTVTVQHVAPGEAWLFGEDGTVWRDRRGVLEVMRAGPPGGTRTTWRVSGLAADNLWAWYWSGKGSSALLHWDGVRFNEIPSKIEWVDRLLGTRAGAVWLIDFGRDIRRWDGSWTTVYSYSFSNPWEPLDLWESERGDVVAVGRGKDGQFMTWDGSKWSFSNGSLPLFIQALRGPRSDDFVALDFEECKLARFDGESWYPATPAPAERFNNTWDFWYGGAGEGWFAVDLTSRTNPGAKYRQPNPAHYRSGRVESTGCGELTHEFNRLWGSAPDDAWAVASAPDEVPPYFVTALYHSDGKAWTWQITPTPVHAIAGSARDDVWTSGAQLRHFDGRVWSNVPAPDVGTVYSLMVNSRSDAWALGESALLHWDGHQWTVARGGLECRGQGCTIWSSGANDAWLADGDTAFHHFDGQTWRDISYEGDGPLRGAAIISGRAADDVWFAVEEPVIDSFPMYWLLHWDGSKLRSLSSIQEFGKRSIVTLLPTAPGQVYTGGVGGLLRWNGQALVPVDEQLGGLSSSTILAMAGGAAEAFAVGEHGAMARFDGSSWRPLHTATANTLHAAWTGGGQTLFAGTGGTILRRR